MKDRIKIILEDITTLEVDAIVNAANRDLRPGGGVCGAIHQAAGHKLENECKGIGFCPVGEARLTEGYKLPAKYIIHTVGPVWHGGDQREEDYLKECYKNSLSLCLIHKIKTVAFPAISTGIFGYPLKEAAQVALMTVIEFLSHHNELEEVILCCFDQRTLEIYESELAYLEGVLEI